MLLLQALTVLLTVGTSAASALPGPLRLAATFSRISNELDHMSLGNCPVSKATIPLNDTSVYLPQPASNLTLKYIAIGRGTQNYTCASSSASAIPVQIGAAATLFDASCLASKSLNLLHEIPAVVGDAPIGSLAFLAELLSHSTNTTDLILGEHYFNAAGAPVIDFRVSGRRDWVVASKNASVDAPQTSSDADQNVPWLKLNRKSGCGIQEVYRVMTYQGSAPSTCAGLNKTLEVQYAAEYWFYGLEALRTTIRQIRQTTGAPSVSCGVLHHGKVFFTHAEGLANIEKGIVPNDETIYPIASNTKAFTAALCGILVDEGTLSWTDPISKYLPEFQTVHDPEVGKRATLLDLCSHGTGLAPLDNTATGFFDEFLSPGWTGVKKASNLPCVYDFRSQWLYNSFLLDVVGSVISSKCRKRSGLMMHERIFGPLCMTRTFTRSDEYKDDLNSARGYCILDKEPPLLVESLGLQDGELQGASGYIRSTVRDMLTWANAVMEAEEKEAGEGFSSTSTLGLETLSTPLRQMRMIRCAHRPIAIGKDVRENSYGLGWFRHTLPSKYLSSIGPNFSLLPDPPVMNQSGPEKLTIAHWGNFGGCLSAFYTFPATRSAIIVMSNCDGSKGDPTDLIAQAICQELFAMHPRIKFEEYALQAATNATLSWESLVEDWVRNRVQNTRCSPLHQYIGTYMNDAFDITIDITRIPEKDIKFEPNPELLTFNINSLPRQTAKLRHYHYDTWTFIPNSKNDAIKKGMAAFLDLPCLLLAFARNDAGAVSELEWNLQGGACEGPAPNLESSVHPMKFKRIAKEKSEELFHSSCTTI